MNERRQCVQGDESRSSVEGDAGDEFQQVVDCHVALSQEIAKLVKQGRSALAALTESVPPKTLSHHAFWEGYCLLLVSPKSPRPLPT